MIHNVTLNDYEKVTIYKVIIIVGISSALFYSYFY